MASTNEKSEPAKATPTGTLRREIGLGAAVMLGLGSMVGTGVFVSLGLSAGLVGPGVMVAVALAGVLAMCNGMSSAQLASAYPVAGGTYEYGHRVGWPTAGAVAGAMFLVAKSASAAAASLGLAGYVLHRFDADKLVVPGAIAVIICLTVLVLEGVRRSSKANTWIVCVTLIGLAVMVFTSLGGVDASRLSLSAIDGKTFSWAALPQATALMFVAYTGYGRIATLGEEVHHPRQTIPKAIFVTVLVCLAFYMAAAIVGVGVVGAERFGELAANNDAPLQAVAEAAGAPAWAAWAVMLAAITALLGVILNLLLGLSRVALAMGRRRHLPALFAKVDAEGKTPGPAVVLVAIIVASLACLGSIKVAWSFSAVTVLIYYALTNAAALRLAPEHRLYPRLFSWLGLLGCGGLSVFVQWPYWIAAAALIALTLGWHRLAQRGQGAATS